MHKALKRGELVMGRCRMCDTDKDITAHHVDYSKPLEVRWLCKPCHESLHRAEIARRRRRKEIIYGIE